MQAIIAGAGFSPRAGVPLQSDHDPGGPHRDNSFLEEIETLLRRPVLIKGDPQLHQEKFDFN
jgi:hypothetical protein